MRIRLLRRCVSLIVLTVGIVFLSMQAATHSLFLAKIADIHSSPESPVIHPRNAKQNAHAAIVANSTTNNLRQTNQSMLTAEEKSAEETTGESMMKDSSVCSSANKYSPDKDPWWHKSRIGNVYDDHDPRLASQYLYQSLLDPWSTEVVNQTICHDGSRFLDPNPDHLSDHDWLVRLLYLGIYLHQHLPAMAEIRARRACRRSHNQSIVFLSSSSSSNVSAEEGDVRCDPSTKYLVVALQQKGAGATFRSGAVAALLAGLAMGRVVVFVNNRRFGSIDMRSHWHLASITQCPRGDYQCYFLPMTPCVLTEDDVKQAATQQELVVDKIKVLKEGRVQRKLKNERIIVMDAYSAPIELFPSALQRARIRIYDLVKNVATKYRVPSHVLEQFLVMPTKDDISKTKKQSNPRREQYHFETSTFHHAALLYVLRPNWKFRTQLEQVLAKTIPNDFNSEWSFGVPIRASDKCNFESTCLTFDQQMQLVLQQYHKHANNDTPQLGNIILTSESTSIMRARRNYTTTSTFPFRFVVNKDDIAQGTGTPRRYRAKEAYRIMLSTIAALRLQLLSKYTAVNCCSNFHQMILDMLKSGCGAVAKPEFQCLQETDDPQFHLCCIWSPEQRCKAAFAALRQPTTITSTTTTMTTLIQGSRNATLSTTN